MARKKSLEELRAIAEKKEKLYKKALKDVEKREAAERARVQKEILAAIEEWRMAAPEDKRMAVEELPAYFRRQAQTKREHFAAMNVADDAADNDTEKTGVAISGEEGVTNPTVA